MGFGRHRDLTYEECYEHHPTYVDWVVRTEAEGQDMSEQLQRFATWIRQGDEPPAEEQPYSGVVDSEGPEEYQMSVSEDWTDLEEPPESEEL